MKIVWLDLNCSYSHSSLALPAIHAQVMDKKEMEWAVVTGSIAEYPGRMVAEACSLSPDIVLATAWLFNHELLLHIVSRLKALMPACVVALGGPEFLGDNGRYLRTYPFIDCVFRGEGEESVPQWLSVWDCMDEWSHVKGLCYMDKDGYHDNGLARVRRFDSLMPPESSPFFRWDKPFIQIETVRGCFNTCSFCVSGGEKPVRTLPLTAVKRRLDNAFCRGVKDVRLLDRTFNASSHRTIAMLELLSAYAPQMRFHVEVHPALLTEDVRKALRSLPHGLLHVEAGIQSLRQEVLDGCGRKGSLEMSLEGLRFLCSLPNMVTHADLIAGLPRYTYQALLEDVCTLASYHAGEIQLESLKVLPGTAMRRHAAEWGMSYAPFPPYEVLRTPQWTPTELQKAARLSRMLDLFYNTSAWQDLMRRLMVSDRTFLSSFQAYLEERNLHDVSMSVEKRGLVLFEYCSSHRPSFLISATMAWIEAGMSLKKKPAVRVRTKHVQPPVHWTVEYGIYHPSLRLCFLPAGADGGWWFGFDAGTQNPVPVFKAFSWGT